MKQKRSEASVLSSVRALLKARGIFHIRNNVGMFRNPKGRPVRFGHEGEADLMAILTSTIYTGDGKPFIRPKPVFIECKGSSGKQSPDQELFQRTVEQLGCAYLLVRSADELELWLRRQV
jgi:hypothetical protein